MNFVNILPTSLILRREYWLSNTHLAISSMIGDNKYTENLKTVDGTKILDNGYFETQEAHSVEILIQNAKKIHATAIVLPDTFYTNDDEFRKNITDMLSIMNINLKAYVIPLGKDVEDVLKAMNILNNINGVDVIAIPDHMLEKYTNIPRLELLEILEKKNLIQKPLHMLALDKWRNLYSLSKKFYIQSIDSTLPWKLGFFEIDMTTGQDLKRPTYYFDLEIRSEEQENIIRKNLRVIKGIL